MKRLAILLATYNGEQYLSEQLDSLLSQTYTNYKIYISDDCSTDKTTKIIAQYAKKYPSKIVDMHNTRRYGHPCKNFLALLGSVEADYYMFCDQDDVWLPTKVERTIDTLQSYEDSGSPTLVHCAYSTVDENLNELVSFTENSAKHSDNEHGWKFYIQRNDMAGCTMAINSTLANLYRSNKDRINMDNIVMHDYLFSLLASLTGKIIYLDEPLMLYRQHSSNFDGAFVRGDKKTLVTDLLLHGSLLLSETLKIDFVRKKQKVNMCILDGYIKVIAGGSKIRRTFFMIRHELCYKKSLLGKIKWLFGTLFL